jgi:thioesterase domain-containing protein
MNFQKFEQACQADIPMVKMLGLNLIHVDKTSLVSALPLAPNINEKGTALGGSLSSAAMVSGWMFVSLHFNADLSAEKNVVIVGSDCQFLAPIDEDFYVHVAVIPDNLHTAKEKFSQRGKAALPLEIKLIKQSTCKKANEMKAIQIAEADVCMTMNATYVIKSV